MTMHKKVILLTVLICCVGFAAPCLAEMEWSVDPTGVLRPEMAYDPLEEDGSLFLSGNETEDVATKSEDTLSFIESSSVSDLDFQTERVEKITSRLADDDGSTGSGDQQMQFAGISTAGLNTNQGVTAQRDEDAEEEKEQAEKQEEEEQRERDREVLPPDGTPEPTGGDDVTDPLTETDGASDFVDVNRSIFDFLSNHNGNPLSRAHPLRASADPLSAGPSALAAMPLTANQAAVLNVVDTVEFSDRILMIHQLLNPPQRLHPWLKWLLYSSRVDKDMLKLYYSTLKKRDQIYQRAIRSKGRLAIMYKDRIFKDIPLYVMPDWAKGEYSLVILAPQQSSSS